MRYHLHFALALIVSAACSIALFAQDDGIAPPEFQNHDVPKELMSAALDMLSKLAKEHPGIRFQVSGPNRIFVYADGQVHRQIRDRLTALAKEQPDPKKVPKNADGPAKGKPPANGDEFDLQIHKVPGGGAETYAKMLQEIFDGSKVRVRPLGANQVLVWADPKTHHVIAKLGTFCTKFQSALIQVNDVDPVKLTVSLKSMFGEPKDGGPYLEADPDNNGVRVSGSEEQIKDVKAAIELRDKGIAPGKNARIITLPSGHAATVAEALQLLVPKMGVKNPFKIVSLASDGVVDNKVAQKKAGKDLPLVTIIAYGNRVVIATEDSEVMDLVANLIRILVNTEAPVCEFETIKLKHAKATHVAQILDEAYNQQVRGGFGGGGFRGAAPSPPSVERIRVVADPMTNTLLLRANPLDAMAIRNLVTRSLDIPDAADPQKTKERQKVK